MMRRERSLRDTTGLDVVIAAALAPLCVGGIVKTFIFDLDGTLAPSKSQLPDEIVVALGKLMHRARVVVISGGAWPQFETQLIGRLRDYQDYWQNLHLMPTCGTSYRVWNGDQWRLVYDYPLDASVRTKLIKVIEKEARRLGLWCDKPWGEIIEDRSSQITFSALGQEAPLAAKEAWDPDGTKKIALRDAVASYFPELSVRAGGSTSVDITTAGVDKAFGIKHLMDVLKLSRASVTFIGDRLDPAGNDYPAVRTGVACHWISDWHDCLSLLSEYEAIDAV